MTPVGRSAVLIRSVMTAALLAASSFTLAAGPVTQPTVLEKPPEYAADTESVQIPFARKLNFGALGSPGHMNVRVSLNDGPPMTFQVDTGSTGIVVGAKVLKDFNPNGEPGNMTYSSSGVSLDGVYNTIKVTFLDAKSADGKPVVAHLPALVATSRKIIPGAVNSTTNPAATQPNYDPRPYMFGVGFGRGSGPSNQQRNPFLMLDAMKAGKMHRGYAITRDGFTLGLNKKSVGDGYTFQQLKQRTPSTQMAEMHPGLKDWSGAPAWVTVDGKDDPMGYVLMDTGLTNMMIGRPDTEQAEIPEGTPITINLMDGKLKYDFVVGDKKNPTTPRRVTRTNRPFVYVNTGLKAFAVFDYLYDADGGYLGLRPTERPTVPESVINPKPTTRRAG